MSAPDDIRRWSDELARHPASMVFLPLGEALRTRGQIDVALRVALRGLERHPYDADAHDLLARIYVDRGETERALDEWDAALRCTAGHPGALKGMGFVCFNQGRLEDAERYLAEAAAAGGEDDGLAMALDRVRAALANGNGAPPSADADEPNAPDAPEAHDSPAEPLVASPAESPVASGAAAGLASDVPAGQANDAPAARANGAVAAAGGAAESFDADPRLLFADLIGVADQAALMLDEDGLVLAGQYVVADGEDVGAEVGAALSGISDEARRAMRHLPLGDWRTIIFETPAATVLMTPAPSDGLVLVAAAPSVPSGLARRALEAVSQRAKRWLEQLS